MRSVVQAVCAVAVFVGIAGFLLFGLGGEAPRIVAEGPAPAPAQDAAVDLATSLKAAELIEAGLPRDRWDPAYVVKGVGKNSKKLFEWVKANTAWIPYRGVLRGPVGVLMDGRGNSLDRALLLADLLKRAGHTVRLAHGRLLQTDAAARLPALIARQVAVADATSASVATTPVAPSVESASALSAAIEALAGKKSDVARTLATLETRVAGQTQRLLNWIAPRDTDQAWSNRFVTALGALQDHWWVQRETASGWVDMDLMTDNGKSPIVPLSTSDDLTAAALHHEITVRVVAEVWTEGKVGTTGGLAEHIALEQSLRPSTLVGRSIVLQFWPTAPIKAQTPAGRDALKGGEGGEWAAMLIIDRDVVNVGLLRESGEDPDTPSLRGALDSVSSANASTLSAVWLEYEIRTPGEETITTRRTVFDLIGQQRRAAGAPEHLVLDGAARSARARAMMMRSELLAVSSGIAPEFVTHLAAQTLTANRQPVSPAPAVASAQTSVPDAARPPAPSVTPLYALALDATNDNGRPVYVDRLLLLTNHAFPKSSQGSVIIEATDIVANEIGISLAVKDAFAMRLREGVRHTNAETVFRGADAIPNTADAFAKGGAWVLLTSANKAQIDALAIPTDARRQILDEVEFGNIVIAPKAALTTASGTFAGWWRIDRTTGATLGFGANGWGQSMGEYEFVAGPVSASGSAFMNAFGPLLGAFAGDTAWCDAPKVDGPRERTRIGLKPTITDNARTCTPELALRRTVSTLPFTALAIDRSLRAPRVPAPPPPKAARRGSLQSLEKLSNSPAAPARLDLATAEARMNEAVRAQKDAQLRARRARDESFKATQAFVKNLTARPNPRREWLGDPANWNEAADATLEAAALRAQSDAAKARDAEGAADAALFAAKADYDAALRDSKTN